MAVENQTAFDKVFAHRQEEPCPIVFKTTDQLLGEMVDSYFLTHGFDKKDKIEAILKRKQRTLYICAFLNFLLLSLCFFHFSNLINMLVGVNLVILLVFSMRYDNKKYIIKQIKSRPDEKITYIIESIMATKADARSGEYIRKRLVNLGILAVSFLLPLCLFLKPHFFYEQFGTDSYYVRFYTIGVLNPETIEVPAQYKGKDVVGIRGNVFRNITSVKKVILPDTIDTIRGNAFSGATQLEEINLPKGLTYIGGGAFAYCSSLREIVIPDTVTEMQGETFVDCTSLSKVVLSQNLTEIRGNSFENCSALAAVEIPEGVTRIGGHAFYGCSSLSEVILPDSLREIGSSAFRCCYVLYEVFVPASASINERAFKESPTTISYR